jgi:predicted Zn-dependent protease
MRIFSSRPVLNAVLAAVLAFCLVCPAPRTARAITIGEEEELSREILRIIFKRYEVIDDPAVAGYVGRVGARIVAALPEQPFRYRFYVINEPAYNAFAIPGGHIFVYSGLLAAMEKEEELAGILGHEIAHVTLRHISQKIELAQKVGWATLAGMAAGVLIGAAGGAAAAASAVTMGSAATGAATQLAFSRENEMQADQLGLQYLGDAGYGAGGLLTVLKKIKSKQWFGKEQIPSYMMTHPAIEDRIVYVDGWIEDSKRAARPAADPAEFERMQTRLIAEYSDTQAELKRLGDELRRQPADTLSRYRYALVLAKADRREEAAVQLKEALARKAFDPYMLRDLGKIYFLDGRLDQAVSVLESARATIPNDPDCLFLLGRAQQELGRRAEALALYTAVVQKAPGFREAYYFLGKSLGEQGSLGDAHYYLGIYHARGRDYKTAAAQFKQALKHPQSPGLRERTERHLSEIEAELKAERLLKTKDKD